MTVKRFSTLILTLTVAALAGCRSKEVFTTETKMVPPGSFIRVWTGDPDFKKITASTISGDFIFLRGQENLVAGYDMSGSLKFRSHIGNGYDVVGEPMVQGERIIYPVSSGLEIYNFEGTPVKRIPFNQPIRSAGVVSGQTVYIGTDSLQGGRLAALALDGDYLHSRWTRLMGGVVHTKPALFENILYTATESGDVIALTTDPVLFWPRSPELKDQIFHTDGNIHAAIKADEAGVYVPSTDTKLYCLDHVTGKIKWEYIAGRSVKNSPQVSADTVYIYIEDRGLVALNKQYETRQAAPRWIAPNAVKVLSDDTQNAYVLLDDGRLAALDKKTGEVRFTSGSEIRFVDGIEHLDPKSNTIFAITAGGTLVAVRPVTTAGVVGALVMLEDRSSDLVIR